MSGRAVSYRIAHTQTGHRLPVGTPPRHATHRDDVSVRYIWC